MWQLSWTFGDDQCPIPAISPQALSRAVIQQLPAGRVLAVAAQLDLVAGRLAVVAAVFPMGPVGSDHALARGMGAFRLGIRHHAPPLSALYARGRTMRNAVESAPCRSSSPTTRSIASISYIAPDAETVREHAKLSGFPANRVSEVRTMIDPTTAERLGV